MNWIKKILNNTYRITVSGGNEKYVKDLCLKHNYIPIRIVQYDVCDWWHTDFDIDGDIIPMEEAISFLDIKIQDKDKHIMNLEFLLKQQKEKNQQIIMYCEDFFKECSKAMVDDDFKELKQRITYFGTKIGYWKDK